MKDANAVAGRAPRRLVVVAVVAGLLVAAGAANALVRDPRPASVPAREIGESAISFTSRISSQAWYCAGPLPTGRGTDSALELVNVNGVPATAEVVVSSFEGVTSQLTVHLAPRSTRRLPLANHGPRRQAAASVVFSGSGAGVAEIVGGTRRGGVLDGVPMGVPCVDHAATTSYLAAGDSRGADNIALALYDPGATPAVANVSFSTPGGPVAPPAFQGVAVGPRSVVVLDVGRALPGQSSLGTEVTATGGQIVGGALLTVARGHGVETSLVSAAPTPGRSFRFPPLPAGPGTSQVLAVFDPGLRPATIMLSLGGSQGATKASATVPAGAVLLLAPPTEPSVGAVRFTDVVVQRGSPVVAAEQLVNGPLPLPSTTTLRRVVQNVKVRVHGRTVTRQRVTQVAVPGPPAPPTRLPALPAGYVVTVGATAAAQQWVLPVAEADPSNGAVVEVADPGSSPARLAIQTLADAPGRPVTLSGIPPLVVPAHGAVTLSLAGRAQPPGPLSLVVASDQRIVVAASIYPRRTAVGFTGALGIPIGP